MSRRTTTWVVLAVWTTGLFAIWILAGVALDEGVDAAAIEECVAEEIIPPDECEEALEELEADDPAPISVVIPFVVWLAGSLVLLWVMTRPKPAANSN